MRVILLKRVLFLAVMLAMFSVTGCDDDDGGGATCGNGKLDNGEECDPTLPIYKECSDFGYETGSLGCTKNCKYDFSSCTGSQNGGTCGDGIVEEDEECEPGDLNGNTCQTEGFEGGTLLCTASCRLDTKFCYNNASGDDDNDSVLNKDDNCPQKYNPAQEDGDDDGIGDACESDPQNDFDGDGVPNIDDNCPNDENPDQADRDNDGVGDACDQCADDPNKVVPGECGCGLEDTDSDDDGKADCSDPCPFDDADACTVQFGDVDRDGIPDESDICPRIYNPEQNDTDSNGNGIPDECEVMDVCTGGTHTCIVTKGHHAMCWGDNSFQQLGAGALSMDSTAAPQVVISYEHNPAPLANVTAITCGMSHTCALADDDGDGSMEVYCWGDNSYGQVGSDDYNPAEPTPMAVRVKKYEGGDSLPEAVQVDAFANNTCARLATNSQLYCWGDDSYGQVGYGTDNDTIPQAAPVKGVEGSDYLTDVTDFSVGMEHACAALSDGSVACWGHNISGQLGIDTTDPDLSPVPMLVKGTNGLDYGSGVFSHGIAAGESHSCIITNTDQNMYCWGDGHNGQLGTGTSTSYEKMTTPVVDTAGNELSPFVYLDAAMMHTCGIYTNSDGMVMCWGSSPNGELGTTGTNNLSADNVLDIHDQPLSHCIKVSTSYYHACAITDDGRLYCWGDNIAKQLGRSTPAIATRAMLVPIFP